MPVMDGKTATGIICKQFLNVKVLVLSTFDDDQYITETMKAGAKGYLLKDMLPEELAQAIRLVYKGYNQMEPGLLEKIIAKVPSLDSDSSILLEKLSALTPREKDVLRWIGIGATNRPNWRATIYIGDNSQNPRYPPTEPFKLEELLILRIFWLFRI